MATENAQTRTLRRALEIAGSAERLAELLACDAAKLPHWLSGEQQTPSDVYLRALDVVSGDRVSAAKTRPRRDSQ